MRTTIDINDAILSELKNRARETNQPFRRVLHSILQRGLSLAPQKKNQKRVQIEVSAVGINPAMSGYSMNQLYDEIESQNQRSGL